MDDKVRIKDLEAKLEEKTVVCKSEVAYNKFLKHSLETAKVQLDILANINRELCEKIAELRLKIK